MIIIKSIIIAFFMMSYFAGMAVNTSAELDKAKKEGKTVFLVITGKDAKGVDDLVKVANAAKAKVAKSVVVQMDKDDAANSALVTKLGVANVTVPFIIVISPKGTAVAGFPPEKATAEALVSSIPSPKHDEALSAINDKKPVFIIVSKKGLTDKKAILADCKTASSKIASKPLIIEIDVDDANESAFLKQIAVTSLNGKTKVVVANASGQITDTYEGTVDIAKLTASANKVVKAGGCCPGGSKSGCGKK